MRAVVQRVTSATVKVGGETRGVIGGGLMVLLGVGRDDTDEDAAFMADRIVGMRIFADSDGKMNLALGAAGGAMLIVSQFTLMADTSHGRRPSFTAAAAPDDARRLYRRFIDAVGRMGIHTEEGEFGATMEVALVNDGPVTIMIDSKSR
jgi:D-tyrosyl-tRNA(Tyr) deacylase